MGKRILTRRRALFATGVGLLGAAAGAYFFRGDAARLAGLRRPHAIRRPAKGQPNILLIVTDQERWDLPLPTGFSLPGHQKLRESGTSFEQYYVTTAPCTPSRSVLFTGQHVPHTQMFDNTNFPYISQLSKEVETLGTMLRAAGYYTAYKGKWHLSGTLAEPVQGGTALDDGLDHRRDLEDYGFSDYNALGDYHGAAWGGYLHDGGIARDAAHWIASRGREVASTQPWLLVTGFINPHDIMFMDNPSDGTSRSNAGPFLIKPAPSVPEFARKWNVPLSATFDDDLTKKPQAQRDYRTLMDLAFGPLPLDRADLWQKNADFYLNSLRLVDDHISTVLSALEASGQADRTIVILTSDHGELLGAHGLRQKGPVAYQENLRVPLIIRHPDGQKGASTQALASAVDLVPSLLSMAGVGAEVRRTEFPDLPGHDLSPALTGRPTERSERGKGVLLTYDAINSVDVGFWTQLAALMERRVRDVRLSELRPNLTKRGFFRGVFDGKHKFVRYFAPTAYNRPKGYDELCANNDLELYDTHADPSERTNLAADPAAHRTIIEAANSQLERLIADEVGNDKTVHIRPLPRPFSSG